MAEIKSIQSDETPPADLIRLVDSLFQMAAVLRDNSGRRIYTARGKESGAALRATVFGIADPKISSWRNGHLTRNGPNATLKFTEELLEIFSCLKKAAKDGHSEEAANIFEFWNANCAQELKLAVTDLTKFADFLEMSSAKIAFKRTRENLAAIGSTRSSADLPALRVGDIHDVRRKGWTGRNLLDELIRIDYMILDGLTVNQAGVPEQWAPVLMDHPDTWRLILDRNDEIAGYWHFVPLFPDMFKRAKEGKLFDLEITSDKVPFIELPGWYDIYFVAIGLMPAHRDATAINLLFSSLVDVIHALAKCGAFIENICANAYTPTGVSLCKSLGLNFDCEHHDKGKIYSASYLSVLKKILFRRNHDLCAAYSIAYDSREKTLR